MGKPSFDTVHDMVDDPDFYKTALGIPRDSKDIYIGSDWKEITYQAEDGTTKHATIRMGYEVIEHTIDKKGNSFLSRASRPMYDEPIRTSLIGKSSALPRPLGERAVPKANRIGLRAEDGHES